jgi:acyl-CoA synthetase (AMP-forming)/AMP-acid ligase II
VAIAEDGEILMVGPHVFEGYHRDPEATADVQRDRWLRSGDLGEIDADGYLHITGRKQDLIITSSGKNISPENLESALRETRWISQAVVAGDRRSYLVALLTLDPEEAPRLAETLGIPADLATMARTVRLLKFSPSVPAIDAVTEMPTAILPSAPIADAIRALAAPGVTHLLVTTGPAAAPRGVVSESDIVRYAASRG